MKRESVDDVLGALDRHNEIGLETEAHYFYDYLARLRDAIDRERKSTYRLLDKCHSFVFDMWHNNRCKGDVGYPLLQRLRRRLKNYWRRDGRLKSRKRAHKGEV